MVSLLAQLILNKIQFKASTYKYMETKSVDPAENRSKYCKSVIHLFEGNMCCQTSISGPNTPIILNANLWKTESKNEMRNKR